jgi:hypothetical protein
MSFLSSSLAAATWAACIALAAFLVRDWVLGQTALIQRQVEHLRDREEILSHARMPVSVRLRAMFESWSRRGNWRPSVHPFAAAGLWALFTGLMAAPLAVISTRLVTNEKALGIFKLFRVDLDPSERMARTVLLILAFAALVRTYPVLDAWLERKARAVGPTSAVGWVLGRLAPIPSLVIFHLLGLTPSVTIVLWSIFYVAGLRLQVRMRGGDSAIALSAHLTIYALLSALIALTSLAMFSFRDGDPGTVAAFLVMGLFLPLASAAGDLVARLAMQGLARSIAWRWPGLWGLLPYLALALCAAGVAVGVFLAALAGVTWLYTLIAPAKYALTLGSAPWERLWDPAYGWPIWVLAAVKTLPILDLLIRTLALWVTQRSAALRKAIRLLADRASPASTAEMLIRAHSIGWIAVGLVVAVPLVVLLLAQA